jgi:hypothetical protein
MDIKNLLKEWIKRDGELVVERALLEKGIPLSTRLGLMKGRHRGEPRGLLKIALLECLYNAKMIQDVAS